jgi:hypothetical protein
MQVEGLPDPAISGRQHNRNAVDDDADMADEPGAQDSIKITAIGSAPFP